MLLKLIFAHDSPIGLPPSGPAVHIFSYADSNAGTDFGAGSDSEADSGADSGADSRAESGVNFGADPEVDTGIGFGIGIGSGVRIGIDLGIAICSGTALLPLAFFDSMKLFSVLFSALLLSFEFF